MSDEDAEAPGAGVPEADDSADDEGDNVIEVNVEEDTDALPPREIERVFSLLETALRNDAIENQQFERLLGVLESAVAEPSDTNPETLAELVSILEDVVDSDGLEPMEVEGVLSVVEGAIADATPGDDEDLEDAFAILEAGLQDPASLTPEDVERFRSGIEGAIVEVTDAAEGEVDSLFPLFGLEGSDEAEQPPEMFRIARVAAAMTQRATGYSIESGIRTGTRMAFAVTNAESVAELLTETRAITLDELQRAGIDVGDERAEWLESHDDELVGGRPMTEANLLERGQRLLSRSAEVGREESVHPAFGSVLSELADDEARILRVLATEGTQACVTVRDSELVPFKSGLVAANLTMLGSDAGCRHAERTPTYLQNLERLGLIAFSEEPVDELKRYQVLEAQPHVEAARESAKRPKTTYKSLHLTDLGVAFCEACLPVEVSEERPGTRFRRDDDG